MILSFEQVSPATIPENVGFIPYFAFWAEKKNAKRKQICRFYYNLSFSEDQTCGIHTRKRYSRYERQFIKYVFVYFKPVSFRRTEWVGSVEFIQPATRMFLGIHILQPQNVQMDERSTGHTNRCNIACNWSSVQLNGDTEEFTGARIRWRLSARR